VKTKKILSIDEYLEKIKSEDKTDDKSSKDVKPIEEESKVKLPAIKVGDFVEDRYGNHYEVADVTSDWKKADEFDDWDQVKKHKDSEKVNFIIVWAKEHKDKKLVFVYGIEDDYAVRKIDITDLTGVDKMTKIFNAVCDNLDIESERNRFKDKWRRFMDMVRAGKIANERYVMMEILDDFKQTEVLANLKKPKKSKQVNEKESPQLGDVLDDGIYDVMYKNDTYYIKPKVGDKKVFAYVDANLSNTVKINGKTLMFKIKDLFGVEKWQKEWTASVGNSSE